MMWILINTTRPTGVEGVGGHGRASRSTTPSRQARVVGGEIIASQISHVIYRGHFSRHTKNAAIPTMQIQHLNKSLGNYVRNQ